MPSTPPPATPGRPHVLVVSKLAEVAELFRPDYPGMTLYLIGLKDGREEMRIPCPIPPSTPPPPVAPADGSNRQTLLEALGELPAPPTQKELFLKAFGGYGTGAQRRALERAVRDGEILELDTSPKTYDLP